ncbi:MAG: hemolysin family protein [Acetatifactor sp.]|nr:hemolysin family protein [Acetatifactor sp.]
MDDGGLTAGIIFFIVVLLLDNIFYGFGAAVRALNKNELDEMAEERKDRKSIRLKRISDEPSRYINTVQLLASTLNMALGAYFVHLWGTGMFGLLMLAALMYIVLSFGVLMPKRLGEKYAKSWTNACITPVWYLTLLLRPFTGLISVTVDGLMFLFGVRNKDKDGDELEEEIINMLQEGHEQGLIEESEAQMISNIFSYGEKEAQDIMTHRNQMIAIDGDMTLDETTAFMLNGNNSRCPVYDENIDNIIGILHFKDVIRYQNANRDLGDKAIKNLNGLLREASYVPMTRNIDEIFQEMQKKKLQMVIVVDEYGQTGGLIAMEDILEEIVGNIMDEYDEDKKYIEEKGTDQYIIDGTTPLEELTERFGIPFEDESFETVNGFLISRLDRIPEPDENFDVDYEGYNFKILKVERKMITLVLVTKLAESKTDENGESQDLILEHQEK